MAKNNGKQTIQGKAFEYACLNAIAERLEEEDKEFKIVDNPAYKTAINSYKTLTTQEQETYKLAGKTAVKIIFPLEPRILNEDYDDVPLLLSISNDSIAKGVGGDVRDIICLRIKSNWEIGFSCKHNHEALKHPRITEAKDFGSAWLGYACSQNFISQMNSILNPLEKLQENQVNWRDIKNKADTYYVPILQAIMDEFKSICAQYSDAPKRLLSYFFGAQDFYKIISIEKDRQTKVTAFNMNGTLNNPSTNVMPIYKVKRIHYPTRLVDIRFKKERNGLDSKTTISLIFDSGWQINMRLHNADTKVKMTGLKFDVQLVGQPNDIYQQQRSWDE